MELTALKRSTPAIAGAAQGPTAGIPAPLQSSTTVNIQPEGHVSGNGRGRFAAIHKRPRSGRECEGVQIARGHFSCARLMSFLDSPAQVLRSSATAKPAAAATPSGDASRILVYETVPTA